MFIVILKFATNRSKAPEYLKHHKVWLQQGFDSGQFLVAGSLAGNQGGGILVHGVTREELERRVEEDPFVAEKVVSAEVIELAVTRTDPRLAFLQG